MGSLGDFEIMCDVAMRQNIREAYFFFVSEIFRETGTRQLALNYGRDYEYWDNYVRLTAGQLLSEEYGIGSEQFMSLLDQDDCLIPARVVEAIVEAVPCDAAWEYWQLLARWKVAERVKYNGYEYSDLMEEWYAAEVCCDEGFVVGCAAVFGSVSVGTTFYSEEELGFRSEQLRAYFSSAATSEASEVAEVASYDEAVGRFFAEIARRYMECTKNKDVAGRRQVRQSLRDIIDELKLHDYVPRDVLRCISHFDDKDAPVVSPSRKDGRKRIAAAARVTDQVFTYTFLDREDGTARIARLFQYLLKAGWLHSDTRPDVFEALFLGQARSFTIKWTGRQQDLYYLIKVLTGRNLIRCPKGATKWVVLGSHIVDSQSRPFTDWNRQKDPKTSAAAIERLADLLDVCRD